VTERLSKWLDDWLGEWVTEWLKSWMTDWVRDLMIDQLNDWLIYCLVKSSDRSINGLTSWLNHPLTKIQFWATNKGTCTRSYACHETRKRGNMCKCYNFYLRIWTAVSRITLRRIVSWKLSWNLWSRDWRISRANGVSTSQTLCWEVVGRSDERERPRGRKGVRRVREGDKRVGWSNCNSG